MSLVKQRRADLSPILAVADETSNGSGLGRCAGLRTQAVLKSALTAARDQANGGLNPLRVTDIGRLFE